MRYRFFFALILSCLSVNTFAQGFNPYGEIKQKGNGFRTFLNKFTLTTASGIGYSFYNHTLDDYTIINYNDRLYINPNETPDYYYQWLNKPLRTGSPGGSDAIVNSDTVSMGFKGVGNSVPLLLSLHYQINRFRIGAGAAFEFHRFKEMEPTAYASTLGPYNESFSTIFTRFFVTGGVEFYRFYDYHYYLDFYAGTMSYGSGFDKGLMRESMFINLGIPIEREFSEYFKVFIRPSYEFKNFSMGLPESPRSIKTMHQAFYVNVGFRFNYPDIRRCPIKSCETQKVHVHQSREFRGRPFYKKQRPQIGENYKHSPLFRRKTDNDTPKSNIRRRDPRK